MLANINNLYINSTRSNIDYLIMPTKLWYTFMQYVINYELNLCTRTGFCIALFFYFAFHTNLQALLYLFHISGLARRQWRNISRYPAPLIHVYLLQLSVYEWHQVLSIGDQSIGDQSIGDFVVKSFRNSPLADDQASMG